MTGDRRGRDGEEREREGAGARMRRCTREPLARILPSLVVLVAALLAVPPPPRSFADAAATAGTPVLVRPPPIAEEFATPPEDDWMLGFPLGILPRPFGAPPPRFSRGKAVDGKVTGRRLLLTFDDGPFTTTTSRLLEILAREKVPAVFFLFAGRLVEKPECRNSRQMARRIVREGHVVGSHTMTHPHLPRLSEARWKREIDAAREAIRSAVGYAPTLFRPPYGDTNADIDRYLLHRGYTRVLWRYSGDEFRGLPGDVVARGVLRQIRERDRAGSDPGGIVLLHDAHSRSVDAAELIIRRIKAENCSLLDAGDENIWRFVGFEPFFEPVNGPERAAETDVTAPPEVVEAARAWCAEHESELDDIREVDTAELPEDDEAVEE